VPPVVLHSRWQTPASSPLTTIHPFGPPVSEVGNHSGCTTPASWRGGRCASKRDFEPCRRSRCCAWVMARRLRGRAPGLSPVLEQGRCDTRVDRRSARPLSSKAQPCPPCPACFPSWSPSTTSSNAAAILGTIRAALLPVTQDYEIIFAADPCTTVPSTDSPQAARSRCAAGSMHVQLIFAPLWPGPPRLWAGLAYSNVRRGTNSDLLILGIADVSAVDRRWYAGAGIGREDDLVSCRHRQQGRANCFQESRSVCCSL